MGVRRVLVVACACALTFCSCQRSPSQVVDKVLVDFGLREKPEGHVSGADKVFQQLPKVGEAELKRMNLAARHGEVKFQKEGDYKGKYYKEVKVYDAFYPLDAQPVPKTDQGDRGYVGYIEFAYRIYQSERKSNRVEAAAASATIPTDVTGRETYKYEFSASGQWDGDKGDKTRK